MTVLSQLLFFLKGCIFFVIFIYCRYVCYHLIVHLCVILTLFLFKVSRSCCKTVFMWCDYDTESTTCLILLYTMIVMCSLSSSNPVTCSEKHFTHNWPWQIAMYPVSKVPVSVTFHNTTIPMINPSIRRVVFSEALGRNFDSFAVMHSYLRHLPSAKNNPNCGSPSSAGDPVEALTPYRLKHILYF